MAGKLTLRLAAGHGTVELDGVDVSRAIRGVRIDATATELPQVTLDLAVFEIEVDAENSRVHVSDEAAALLVELGWQRPHDCELCVEVD